TVSVHRLVQTITRHNPPAGLAAAGTRSRRWWQRSRSPHGGPTHPAETAAQLLRQAVPTGDPLSEVSGWPRWQALLPHTDALAGVTPREAETTAWSYLLDRSATYQQAQGEHNAAITKLEHAATLKQHLHGPDHPDTLTTRNNLGLAYQNAGRTAEAI